MYTAPLKDMRFVLRETQPGNEREPKGNERLAKHPDAKALTTALDRQTNSTEWDLWVDLRNRMTHRSNLPRIIQGAVGAEPPPAKALHFAAASSTPAFEADVAHLEVMFGWLSQSLRRLLVEGQAFASRPESSLRLQISGLD